jgi:hypothetical protein
VSDSEDIAAKISQLLETAARCASTENEDNFSILGDELGELESRAGQSLRSHAAYEFLISKLEDDGQLTPDDLKTLRALIVGDADAYLRYDDGFDEAKRELARVIDKIRQLQAGDLEAEALMQLRVLCREAMSALAPAVHYLEQKQRVKNFEEHTTSDLSGDMSSDTRRALARMIGSLAS